MPAPADEPLRRFNLQLYERDYQWLYRRHGHGISEVIRRLIRAHIRNQDAVLDVDMKVIGASKE